MYLVSQWSGTSHQLDEVLLFCLCFRFDKFMVDVDAYATRNNRLNFNFILTMGSVSLD